jgi:glutathione peroxidase
MRPHRVHTLRSAVARALQSALLVTPVLLACSGEAAPPKGQARAAAAAPAPAKGVPLDHTVTDITGKAVDLKAYRGKALLIVNVASECGYTPQYAELQQLHARYQDRGLVVLGFPSNDHGGQEPNDGAAILAFAQQEYGVTFPLFAKVHTKGPDMAPLYRTLSAGHGAVDWNFNKFLVGPDGVVVARFGSAVGPLSDKLTAAIEAVLPAAR